MGVLLVTLTRSPPAMVGESTEVGGTEAAPPDISNMSPRERFDRLYNRVMQAAQSGDEATVTRFTPMALMAYAQLDSLDADARYHAALLEVHTGDVAGPAALADTILTQHPGHLFGYVIRGTVARWQKDDKALARAYRDFSNTTMPSSRRPGPSTPSTGRRSTSFTGRRRPGPVRRALEYPAAGGEVSAPATDGRLGEHTMKAGHKFLLGAALIVGSVGFLIAQGVKETGVYFLTPTELAAKTAADPTFYDVGLKMGAKVVPGSIRRDAAPAAVDFAVSDGAQTYPVTYRGLVPDTFTDANDIEVIVEGRLGRDGVFHATEVLAKCGSRYEAVPEGLSASMTLLGNSRCGRPSCSASGAPSSPSPAAGRTGPSWPPPSSRSRLRRVRPASWSRRWRSGRGSSPTTSTSSTCRRTPRATSRSGYLFSAFWAGQKGSLLFWAVVLSLFAALAQALTPRRYAALMPYVGGRHLGGHGVLRGVMLFGANPFERLPFTPVDGRGLNPQLQNPGMMIHPPMLYLGYISITIPFAFAMAALLSRAARHRLDPRDPEVDAGVLALPLHRHHARHVVGLRRARLGRLLGLGPGREREPAAVAHHDRVPALGHDPGKAGHAQAVEPLARSSAPSCSASSGPSSPARASSRACTASPSRTSATSSSPSCVLTAVLSFTLLYTRWPLLEADVQLESMVSREAAFLFNNLLFVGIAFSVLWGTLFPILSEAVRGTKITVGPPFFNQVNVPLGPAAAGAHRHRAADRLAQGLDGQPAPAVRRPGRPGAGCVAGGAARARRARTVLRS